ncbi:hypothetical protein ABZ281_07605 [Streptomyces sp. NPDC006265]|uniref:hypothetical protein n=1 Tax=Streptomyces sp. NPDC006265 TaxID=3156740 RepID=UPI0033AB94F5
MAMQPVRVQLDDSPIFEATADLGDRWNNFLRPRFNLDQIRTVAEYTQAMNREHGVDWETVHVVDQATANRFAKEGEPAVQRSALVLLVSWQFTLGSDGPSKWVTVVDPDPDGLYDIGGGSWAWSYIPEPDRIPVEELKGLAGRHVHFVGEFDDPWDVYTHEVALNDWRQHYTNFSRDKQPVENSYFSISDALDIEWDEAAELIADLPVCFVMTGDMELGLCPTSRDAGWQWSLIEAFTRLGVLPPTNDLYLPDRMDIPRSPELIRYLMAAFRAGVAHEVKVKQDLAANASEYLAKIEAKVLASK